MIQNGLGYAPDGFDLDDLLDDDDIDRADDQYYSPLCSAPRCNRECDGGMGCEQCGAPLCHMHAETGAGFCHQHPDQDFQGYDEPAPDNDDCPF